MQHAAKMMSAMLKWREANGVNVIREEIMNEKLFDPRCVGWLDYK